MTQIVNNAIAADQLAEGDIIKNASGDAWLILSEPEYTTRGICFDILWLDVDTFDNIQSVCFVPDFQFELVDSQPIPNKEEVG